MTATRTFSDDDLSLFLDGEAPDDVTRAIEAGLQEDATIAARLEELRAAETDLNSGFEALLGLAPQMPELPKPQTAARPAWVPALAGMAAGIAVAMGVAWTYLQPKQPGWREVVANYQSLYVTETLAEVTATPEQSAQKLADLSETLGLDLTQLPELEGLQYRRAQQLGFKGKPLAQLTFLTADGGPVALCIIPTSGSDSEAILSEVLDGMDAFSWVDNGYGVLLIGPQGETLLPSAAREFRRALQQVDA